MVKTMNNKYLNKLIECISKTEICVGNDRSTKLDYTSDTTVRLIVNEFLKCRNEGKTAFFIGNGGSAAIASHMTADYLKNGKVNTCSLYDNAVTTCIGNDYGYEYIFSKPLEFLMKRDDLLVAISSSGNSMSIVNAIKTAREKSSRVITFTGFSENNPIRTMGDINLWVPCDEYGIVESIHNLILQQIVDEIMKNDSGEHM